MVKITIKPLKPEETKTDTDSEEDEESSEEEEEEVAVEEQNNTRTKRKCVLKLERKKERLRTAVSRSKSGSPSEELPVAAKKPKRMFTCDACSKAFHSNFVLKVHLRAHKKIDQNPDRCDKYYHYYYHSVN